MFKELNMLYHRHRGMSISNHVDLSPCAISWRSEAVDCCSSMVTSSLRVHIYCYVLYCCAVKFLCWSSNPSYDGIWGEVFRGRSGLGEVMRMEFSGWDYCPYKWIQLSLPAKWGYRVMVAVCKPGRGTSPDFQSASKLILGPLVPGAFSYLTQ